MLKKSLLSLAITASVAGLSGCNISSVTDNDQATPDSQIVNEAAEAVISSAVSANFDVTTSVIPIGSDLYLGSASATDGTANTGLQGTAKATPASDGIDRLDGGIGVTTPIDIAMSGSIDTSTISGGQVLLVRLANSDLIDALDVKDILGQGANAIVPADQPSIANGDYRVEAISVDGGTNNTIRVVPLKPLVEKTKYLVVITDGVKADGGAALGQSPNYEYAGGTDPLYNSGFEAVRLALQAWTGLADGFLTAAFAAAPELKPGINFVSAYTTVSINSVTAGMASPQHTVNSFIDGAVASSVKSAVRANTALDQTDFTTVWANIEAGYAASGTTIQALQAAVTAAMADAPEGTFSTPISRTSSFLPSAAWIDDATFGGANGGKMIQGQITLPYYLTAPAAVASSDEDAAVTTAAQTAILNTEMTGDVALGGILKGALTTGMTDEEAEAVVLPTLDADKESYVNGRFPFAQKTSDVTVPVLVHMPDANQDDTVDCGSAAVEAATGTLCPVTIFVHGIGRNRTDSLPLANGGLVAVGSATVAIDLPLHGLTAENGTALAFSMDDAAVQSLSTNAADPTVMPNIVNALLGTDVGERHFGYGATATGAVTPLVYNNVSNPDVNEAEVATSYPTFMNNESAANFINLNNFAVMRDLLRQSSMDMLNLAASLGDMDVDGHAGADFDVANIHVVGHSLGSIVAVNFVHALNTSRYLDGQALLAGGTLTSPMLPEVQSMSLVTPGGQLSRLLENSVSFAGLLDAPLLNDDNTLNDNFGLLAGLNSAGATQGTTNFESFMNIFQGLIDEVDPISKASSPLLAGTPTLAIEVIGDNATEIVDGVTINKPDQTIPNSADAANVANAAPLLTPLNAANSAPLAGTEPLVVELGLENNLVTTLGGTNTAPRQVMRLVMGEHSSLLTANPSSVDGDSSAAEIASFTNTSKSQGVQIGAVASFISTGGTTVQTAVADVVSTVAP